MKLMAVNGTFDAADTATIATIRKAAAQFGAHSASTSKTTNNSCWVRLSVVFPLAQMASLSLHQSLDDEAKRAHQTV
jgi:uncharacterized protein (DUF983 family)